MCDEGRELRRRKGGGREGGELWERWGYVCQKCRLRTG